MLFRSGVLAGEDAEYAPGTEITVSGRLTGTVTDETLLWTQTSGDVLEGIDWTSPEFTFVVDEVEGIETYQFELVALDGSGNEVVDEDGNPLMDDVKITVFDPDAVITLEAEESRFSAELEVATDGHEMYIAGASGDAHLTDMLPGTEVVFDVEMDAESAGLYSLYLNYAIGSGYGGKQGTLSVNGVEYSLDLQETGAWEELRVGTVSFEAGTTEVTVCCGWNYYRVDAIKLVPSSGEAPLLPVPATLTNENATDEAVALMEYMVGHYGTNTITGQTEFMSYADGQTGLREYQKVVDATGGDAPAIVAFDYMDYSTSRADHSSKDPGTLTEDMITEQAEKNVLLSALWHWSAPSGHPDGEIGSFYTSGTTFDLAAALADPNGQDYQDLIDDMDIVAAELKKLQDAGVPVLWRPIHEAEGGWFWWGAAGADAFKELWVLMYDRYTNHHGLNNLIWVFTNTDGLGEDWYPGDDYVDIVGFDGYDQNDPSNDQNPFVSQFNTLKERHNGKKLVALTESGAIPDVELMHENSAFWSFFITWNTDSWNSPPNYGPGAMDPAVIAENYSFGALVNNDDLPGGVEKVGAGTVADFDRTDGFEAQVNWGPTTGLAYSSAWSRYGDKSMGLTKDLSAIADLANVVLQTYPAIEIGEQTSISLTAYAMNAGADVNVHMFVKGLDADGNAVEQWPEATAIGGAPVELSLDITGYTEVSGYGVRFQSMDPTQTDASFFIDSVMLDDTMISDFESVDGYEGQINWSGAPGLATSKDWSASGEQAIAFLRDLTEVEGATDVIIQTYPEGGIDVSMYDSITVDATAMNAVGAQVMLFVKDQDDAWTDSGAVDADNVELTIDLTEIDHLNGFGIRFINFDAASTDAKFLADYVRFSNTDGDTLYEDFEQLDGWEGQVNWAPTSGLTPSESWGVDGTNSMSLVKDLSAETEPGNVVLQTYLGLKLEDGVTAIKLTAYAADAGADVNVHLFVKGVDADGNPAEQWPEAVNVDGAPVELMLDITGYQEVSGYGVRFQGLDATATEAKFYVDSVLLEAATEE